MREKIETFEQFASTPLDELYSPEELGAALKLETNTLESVALMNDGAGKFTVVKLPWLAQISPAFGVVLTDVDADGLTDAYLAQNFSQAQRETGPMNASVSALLRGTGKTDAPFEAVPPPESGLLVPEDARSIAVCDANNDARPDFFVGLNNAHPSLFFNQAKTETTPFSIRLRGPAGNPTAIGAKIFVQAGSAPQQTAEIYAGNSYLSQSDALLFFAAPPGVSDVGIGIRWPDGEVTTHQKNLSEGNQLVIEATEP